MATFGSTVHTEAHIRNQRPLQTWLFAMAALVFLMVAVGGATRLTGSGLSITEWQPVMGVLPPLGDAAWQDAFEKYKQIPQYKILNKGMSLEAFKSIYWWEWGHRFLGRLIGLAFLVPFLFFIARGAITRALAWRLGGLFLLGGTQGVVGWYMVKSGLSQRTDVSQYRLAAHLLLASVLLAALLWTALNVGRPATRRIQLHAPAAGSRASASIIVALIFAQIGAGALVAGLKAGLAYNTWPLMDGHMVPGGLGVMVPFWLNVFENAATVQFDHRLLAYVLAAAVLWHGLRILKMAHDAHARRSAAALILMVTAQIALGIWTLLAHVPLPLALGHQMMAMLVLATAVWHLHTLQAASSSPAHA
jgi:heme a synthase